MPNGWNNTSMTDKTKQEKKTTTECPCCLIESDECICGLSALVNMRIHEAGELCCIKNEDDMHTFVLIIDNDGVTEIHNYLKDNLATTIIWNCNTVGMRQIFDAQSDLARKHAVFILQQAKATT